MATKKTAAFNGPKSKTGKGKSGKTVKTPRASGTMPKKSGCGCGGH